MHTFREQLAQFDWSLKSITKAAAAVVVAVVALAIVIGVLRFATTGLFSGIGARFTQTVSGEFADTFGFDEGIAPATFANVRGGRIAAESVAIEPGLLPPTPYDEGGANAEDYERRDYRATYETRRFAETCTAISSLKPLDYVVFDNTVESEDWCSYVFRVDVAHEDEIVAKLKTLNPRDFRVTTSTIERSIEYSDSELAMQRRRLTSLQQTLAQAESSFNSLIARATREGETKTLSDVINNKIATIERLNQQILNVQERIDRLSRGRGEQIEQIEYAHFNVSVSKLIFFDRTQFADIWKQRIQELFLQVNATLLALTVGLAAFVLRVVQFVIFAALTIVILVVFAKFVWMCIRRIWRWDVRWRRGRTLE